MLNRSHKILYLVLCYIVRKVNNCKNYWYNWNIIVGKIINNSYNNLFLTVFRHPDILFMNDLYPFLNSWLYIKRWDDIKCLFFISVRQFFHVIYRNILSQRRILWVEFCYDFIHDTMIWNYILEIWAYSWHCIISKTKLKLVISVHKV